MTAVVGAVALGLTLAMPVSLAAQSRIYETTIKRTVPPSQDKFGIGVSGYEKITTIRTTVTYEKSAPNQGGVGDSIVCAKREPANRPLREGEFIHAKVGPAYACRALGAAQPPTDENKK